MAGWTLKKSSGLAALAAGIAMLGAPMAAQAQRVVNTSTDVQTAQAAGPEFAQNEGGWRGRRAGGGAVDDGGGNSGGGRWNRGAERSEAPAAPQAAPAEAPQQRSWRGRGGDAVATPAPQAAPPVVQAPQPQGNRGWQGNNSWRGRGNANSGQAESGWRNRSGGWNGGGAVAAPVPQAPESTNRDRNGGERRSWRGSGQQGQSATQTWRGNNTGSRGDNWSRSEQRDDGNRWNQNSGWNNRNRESSNGDNWRGDGRRYESNRRYEGDRNSGWNGGNRYTNDHRQWSRDWRRNDRYNWQSHRTHNRSVYRIGRYYSPYRNHYYSRLSIGFYLDSLFYANNYWISDPWQYRLPEVYGPYRWVRYYDDAVLVDVYSGEVVDVIYDFFW